MSERNTLAQDLERLGVQSGDGLFVHASMRSVGAVSGGIETVIQAFTDVLTLSGLLVMPGFSTDAMFPENLDRSALTASEISRIEDLIPGFDPSRSPASGMGVLAERFRTWPGVVRSVHPSVSVCAWGSDAHEVVSHHSISWATGPDTPFGKMLDRPNMKVALLGVGWNRCTFLHMAETFADPRRTKVRRCKIDGVWREDLDVADDLGRLFPKVGEDFEKTGAVTIGKLGAAEVRVCDVAPLITFAAKWIGAANAASGDRH